MNFHEKWKLIMAHLTPKDHAFNDLTLRRAIARMDGDVATVRECDEELSQLELLDQPSVRILHGAKPGEAVHL